MDNTKDLIEVIMEDEKFVDFLREEHAKQYTGTDDDMPDNFDHWTDCLSHQEILNYADQYKK